MPVIELVEFHRYAIPVLELCPEQQLGVKLEAQVVPAEVLNIVFNDDLNGLPWLRGRRSGRQQQEIPALYPETLPTCYGSTSQPSSTPQDLSDYGLVVLVGNLSVNHFTSSKGQPAETEMVPEEADLDTLLADNVMTGICLEFGQEWLSVRLQ